MSPSTGRRAFVGVYVQLYIMYDGLRRHNLWEGYERGEQEMIGPSNYILRAEKAKQLDKEETSLDDQGDICAVKVYIVHTCLRYILAAQQHRQQSS